MLAPFKEMFDRGNVAIVQGAGYPEPDHSHFRSTEIWQTAHPKGYESTGWIGRYFDDATLPENNLFNAVAMSNVLPEIMVSKTTDVPAIAALRGYGLRSDKTTGNKEAFHEFVRDTTVPFRSPFLARSRRSKITRSAVRKSCRSSSRATDASDVSGDAARPQPCAGGADRRLEARHARDLRAARLVRYARLAEANAGALLDDFANAISAFYEDLAAHGNDKRVLTMTFSEFGRRVAENASRGTDHGEAARCC